MLATLWLQDPVLDQLYAHFRSFWPEPPPKKAKTDDYLLVDGEAQENAVEPKDDAQCSDVGLAEALGVPTACIEKMSPKKLQDPKDLPTEAKASTEHVGTEPTLANLDDEGLDERIRQLQCPGLNMMT